MKEIACMLAMESFSRSYQIQSSFNFTSSKCLLFMHVLVAVTVQYIFRRRWAAGCSGRRQSGGHVPAKVLLKIYRTVYKLSDARGDTPQQPERMLTCF
ncbi:hypothetical protein O3P16_08885 [Chitinophagaceae bacterium LY-5]|uniref:Uncharacterized protein n=1 Tax=Polluticaenibacter yanchengensis TaxID=3014562 RepID=A0ABT4UJB4_9BACT|nr:hypothetical protein [Chitinophagaceae bacterium LY-5]